MKKPLLLTLVSVVPLVALGASCTAAALAAGAAAGVAGTAYVRGNLEADVEADPAAVAQATEDALAELELPVLSTESNELDGQVLATTAQGDKIRIDIEGLADERSRVSIRVGTFGDREKSSLILERIRQNLAA